MLRPKHHDLDLEPRIIREKDNENVAIEEVQTLELVLLKFGFNVN